MASPKISDWLGTWYHPGGSVEIKQQGDGGKLHVEGEMVVSTAQDSHNGQLEAQVTPQNDTIALCFRGDQANDRFGSNPLTSAATRPTVSSRIKRLAVALLTCAGRHPYTIHMDGEWMVMMAENVRELRPKTPDTEKITINLGYVDLGHVDLMVQEGFYSNRTDFIRTAIRNQLERHADVVKQSTVRNSLDLGLRNYSREDLEAARRAGEMLHINVLGLASIAQDVTPELARATIASVAVLGALHASPAVKAAIADRTR